MTITEAMLKAYQEGLCCRPFMWRGMAIQQSTDARASGVNGWETIPRPGYHAPTVYLPSVADCLGPWEVVTQEQVCQEALAIQEKQRGQ